MAKIICPECDSTNVNMNALHPHINPDQQFLFTCKDCGEQFGGSSEKPSKLHNLAKGDRVRLTENGIGWTVVRRSQAKTLVPVIVLKSDNGSFRFYSSHDTAWHRRVWPVRER